MLSYRRAQCQKLESGRFPLLPADLKSLNESGDRFLLEPRSTFMHRSKLVFYESHRPFNLSGLIKLQRIMSRSQYCESGNLILQGSCAGRCKGCQNGHSTVDGSHARVASDSYISMAVNTASVIRL